MSLGPVVRAPGTKHGLKSVALTQFPRCHVHSDATPWADGGGQSYACMSIERDKFDVMGESYIAKHIHSI